MITIDVHFPQADIDKINSTLFYYANYLHNNIPKTIEKTMVKIIVAMRAANTTMISGKVRKIVNRPSMVNKNADSKSRQRQHIADYYVAKEANTKLAIERFTQKGVKYIALPNMRKVRDAKRLAEYFYPDQYNIAKRGLARASWAWMLKGLKKPTQAEQPEISGAVTVSRENITANGVQNFSITGTNKLNYIKKALKMNVSTALYRAEKMMINEIEGHKKGAKQASRMAA